MRHNHDRHNHNRGSIFERYDIVYTPLHGLGATRMLIAHPLHTIYVNTAAKPDAQLDRQFRDFDSLLDFIARYGVELP